MPATAPAVALPVAYAPIWVASAPTRSLPSSERSTIPDRSDTTPPSAASRIGAAIRSVCRRNAKTRRSDTIFPSRLHLRAAGQEAAHLGRAGRDREDDDRLQHVDELARDQLAGRQAAVL